MNISAQEPSSRNTRYIATIDKKKSLLDLPIPILVHVMTFLDLHDIFLLYRCCTATRNLLPWNWQEKYNALEYHEKISLLTGVAAVSPDRWVCASCVCLHATDCFDTPHTRSWACSRDRQAHLGIYQLGRGWRFQVRPQHVQLALKYCRMGIHYPRLRDILKPYTLQEIIQGEGYVYRVEPRLSGGRFILGETWTVHLDRNTCGDLRPPARDVFLCPHLSVPLTACLERLRTCCNPAFPRHIRHEIPETLFLLRLAFDFAGRKWKGSCMYCNTEYCVTRSPQDHSIIFSVRRDLGGYGSPLNVEWRSQTSGSVILAPGKRRKRVSQIRQRTRKQIESARKEVESAQRQVESTRREVEIARRQFENTWRQLERTRQQVEERSRKQVEERARKQVEEWNRKQLESTRHNQVVGIRDIFTTRWRRNTETDKTHRLVAMKGDDSARSYESNRTCFGSPFPAWL